ncbi:MAG: RNA polymerase sigma factor [Planctomycetota bacterium]
MARKHRAPAAGDEDSRRAMLRAQEGDRKAFEKVARDYANMVLAIALHMLGSREEAMDCAQDAFVRAWENVRRYDARWSVATWLRRITTNLAVDRLRRRKLVSTFPEGLEESAAAAIETPAQAAERNERAQLVHRLLDLLPEKYRAVLVLREMEGLDVSEISRITGIQAPTVRWRLHRARALFKDRWRTIVGRE